MKCTCGKDGCLRMMMTCELAQEDSAGTGTENSPWKQHWTMQKVWVLVLNGLMPGISYCCGKSCKRFRSLTEDFSKSDFKLRELFRAFPKIDEDCRGISRMLHCTPTHCSSFKRGITPGQKWHHRYTDYYNYQYRNYYTSRSLIFFLLIPQRVVSESPTVCTWCMPAWNQWRSRLSFLIGMTHLTSSEYRKRFVHLIWLAFARSLVLSSTRSLLLGKHLIQYLLPQKRTFRVEGGEGNWR